MTRRMPVLGVLLAGGLSRRMGGGDKCLRDLGGRTVLDRVIGRAGPQVARLVLNANGDAGRFAGYGLPVVADVVEGHPGPLAGVLTGMEWARAHAPECPLVATFPTDAPFFPVDLVEVMEDALRAAGADMACAASDGRSHPVFGLWPVRLAADLRHAIVADGVRKVHEWTASHRVVEVDFPIEGFDPFFNANRPEDLDEAERLLRAGEG